MKASRSYIWIIKLWVFEFRCGCGYDVEKGVKTRANITMILRCDDVAYTVHIILYL